MQPRQLDLMMWEGTMLDKAPCQCLIEHKAVLRENKSEKKNKWHVEILWQGT
jgi:hypothetical protein